MTTNDEEIAKAIERAFAFHPFGFERPQQYDDWIMGPTFIVRPELDASTMVFNTMAGVYLQDPDWQVRFGKILAENKKATQTVQLDRNKHNASPKCTYRMFTGEPDAKFPLELGFPLVSLARKVGAASWRAHPGANNIMLFADDADGNLIAIFAGRRVLEDHIIPAASNGK